MIRNDFPSCPDLFVGEVEMKGHAERQNNDEGTRTTQKELLANFPLSYFLVLPSHHKTREMYRIQVVTPGVYVGAS